MSDSGTRDSGLWDSGILEEYLVKDGFCASCIDRNNDFLTLKPEMYPLTLEFMV